MASGMVFPIAQAYIGDMAPKDEEGKWMSYYNVALFTGFGFGPLMGGILAEQFGMNSAFYTMGFFNLIAFLAVSLFLPEIRHQERATGARASFKEIAASNTMRGIFSFQLGSASARGVFSTFLPIFAGIYLGLRTSLIGVLLTIQILGASLLQVPSGRIADRKIAGGLNRRVLVVLGSFVSLTAYGLIPSAGSFWILAAICIILSLGDASAMPAVAAMTVTEGRKFGMGVTMAMYNMIFNVGMALGPILAGVIADSLSTTFVFYFGAAIVFAGVIAFGLFTR
jgi:MFS family permease